MILFPRSSASANVFYIMIGMLEGAEVTLGAFLWRNLLAATLGNILGGATFLGVVPYLTYDDAATFSSLSGGRGLGFGLGLGTHRPDKQHRGFRSALSEALLDEDAEASDRHDRHDNQDKPPKLARGADSSELALEKM
eukprot:g67493.t1